MSFLWIEFWGIHSYDHLYVVRVSVPFACSCHSSQSFFCVLYYSSPISAVFIMNNDCERYHLNALKFQLSLNCCKANQNINVMPRLDVYGWIYSRYLLFLLLLMVSKYISLNYHWASCNIFFKVSRHYPICSLALSFNWDKNQEWKRQIYQNKDLLSRGTHYLEGLTIHLSLFVKTSQFKHESSEVLRKGQFRFVNWFRDALIGCLDHYQKARFGTLPL